MHNYLISFIVRNILNFYISCSLLCICGRICRQLWKYVWTLLMYTQTDARSSAYTYMLASITLQHVRLIYKTYGRCPATQHDTTQPTDSRIESGRVESDQTASRCSDLHRFTRIGSRRIVITILHWYNWPDFCRVALCCSCCVGSLDTIFYSQTLLRQ
jgi:hypothetical protein